MPLEAQRETVLIGTLSGDASLRGRSARPWYERHDGDRPIIVGHSVSTSTLQVLRELKKELAHRQLPAGGTESSRVAERIRDVRQLLSARDEHWIGVRQARSLLGVRSDATVRAKAKHGFIRGTSTAAGRLLLLLDDVLKEREEDEALCAFGGDELSHEELMYLLRPNSYPKPLQWRRRAVKGKSVDHERLMAILVRLPEDYEPYVASLPTPATNPAPARRGFDPGDMARRGRIGALVLHATHDARQTTQKARESFLLRFEREVDPDGVLPEGERRRRAEYARRAYFAVIVDCKASRTLRQAVPA
ncbi:MAG: hypothetical protein HY332_18760, partial [Chloroflexi bacterium]|nr:hypothetical protein [Chloroflexota bacterium]